MSTWFKEAKVQWSDVLTSKSEILVIQFIYAGAHLVSIVNRQIKSLAQVVDAQKHFEGHLCCITTYYTLIEQQCKSNANIKTPLTLGQLFTCDYGYPNERAVAIEGFLWFVKVAAFLSQTYKTSVDEKISLKEALEISYPQTLEPDHPLQRRLAVKVILKLCPADHVIYHNLIADSSFEEGIKDATEYFNGLRLWLDSALNLLQQLMPNKKLLKIY